MNSGIFRPAGPDQFVGASATPISLRYAGTPTRYPYFLTTSNSGHPFFRYVPPQSVQFGDEFVRYTGKWVDTFDFRGPSASGITCLYIDDLEGTNGNCLTFNGGSSDLLEISAPELKFVGGSIFTANLSALTRLHMPKLQFVAGTYFCLNTFAALTEFNFPSLTAINQASITIPAATSILLPLLRYAGGAFTLQANSMTNLDLPSFHTMAGGGSAFAVNGTSATSMSLPSLYFLGGGWNISSPLLTTLTLPPLGNWKHMLGNPIFNSCALNQSSVDGILAALAYMDGTNGTTTFGSGRTATITGTSAAPSNAGSTTTAGSNFVCSGITCTVNLTAHGYSTGDVLRISGITTATNANRYAVITVTGPNQFTYTITSQTATGAGTATVVKANADAKALVTRGVTLTTN